MLSTIYILWLRQLKRYWRSKSRIVGSLGQPILFLLALGFGMRSMFARAGGGDYITFLVPGVIIQATLFMAVFSGIELIWDRQFGFLKETLVAPVSRLEIMIGRTLGGATIATIQGIFVFLLSLLISFRPRSGFGLLIGLLTLILTATLYTALGTAIASTLKDFHGFQLIMNFLVMPSFFLSGALFPVSQSPKAMQTILKFNPLSYGVDAVRFGLSGQAFFGLDYDILILSLVTVILLFIGTYLFSKIEV